MSRRLEYERLAERRRERKLTVERQRLRGESDDGASRGLGRRSVRGRRAPSYGFRNLERGIGALEGARSFADTMLRAARCDLPWSEERAPVTVARKTLREVSRVIKEAVTNIVRHAQAEKRRIRVEYPDGRIRVTIHDNGVGFPVH